MNPLYYIICGLSIFFILFLILYLKQKNKNKRILSNLDKEYNTLKQQKEEEYNELQQRKEKEIEEKYNELGKKLNNDYTQRLVEINEYLINEIEKANISKQKQLEAITEEISHRKQEKEKILSQQIEAKRIQSQAKLQQELDVAKEWFNEEIQKLQDSKRQYEDETNEAAQEYVETLEVLEDFRARREVINSQVLREKEIQEKTDFYRICLSENDIEDLNLIKEIEHRFNNKEVLHRAAFDCYIKRPLQEMEKRVLNGRKPSGIYIITYIPTGEIYIGRSTDLAGRWLEHSKSAYGIGTIAHSSLHTKMARDGIWNFTFQILEEVPKEKLNEREKYWIDVYGAQTLLNQKAGG